MRSLLAPLLLVGCLQAGAANAQNLVVNGDFEILTNPANNNSVVTNTTANYVINSPSNPTWSYDLQGWSNGSWVGVAYAPGQADQSPVLAPKSGASLGWDLFGPGNGHANNLPASSPVGGRFYGADSNYAPYMGPLTQSVSGLVVGQTYTLSFWWAAATLQTSGGNTDQQSGWQVSLTGTKKDVNESVLSASFNNLTGSVGWTQEIVQFTASKVAETLSFMPIGSGSPPMSLLDGVAILPGSNVVPAVPEPSTWLSILLGGGVLAAIRRRSRRASSAAAD